MTAPLIIPGRDVPLGGVRGITVNRTLPSRQLPTIGAWCFLDRFGPAPADAMVVLPHPHTALQTVTWPLSGRIHHRDSVGSDVIVQPGELNLMTAGGGVSHSELSLRGTQPLTGLQLWVALPDDAVDVRPSFEQHTELPTVDLANGTATVLTGDFGGVRSPATAFTPLVGVQLDLRPGRTTIELDRQFEHGLLMISGRARLADTVLDAGPLHYLATGTTGFEVEVAEPAVMILLGGRPFDADLVMWWNFIGRSHADIVAARTAWEDRDDRFGRVAGHGEDRIPAPPLPTTTLRPRRRRLPPT